MRRWTADGSFELTAEDKAELNSVPGHLRGAIVRYIEHGVPPGDFLGAVITNDLFEAIGRADEISRASLLHIVRWFYNNAPRECYGTTSRMVEWVKTHKEAREAADVAAGGNYAAHRKAEEAVEDPS